MESTFKNVKNNELIPLVDLMIDRAKQAEVCNLGPDAPVYTTRAKTEEKPELVPAWFKRANLEKHNGTPVHFHERIQLWGTRAMLATLEETGREIAKDGPQTVQAVALALREKVASARPLAQSAVEGYIQWLESLLPAEGAANGGANGPQGSSPLRDNAPALPDLVPLKVVPPLIDPTTWFPPQLVLQQDEKGCWLFVPVQQKKLFQVNTQGEVIVVPTGGQGVVATEGRGMGKKEKEEADAVHEKIKDALTSRLRPLPDITPDLDEADYTSPAAEAEYLRRLRGKDDFAAVLQSAAVTSQRTDFAARKRRLAPLLESLGQGEGAAGGGAGMGCGAMHENDEALSSALSKRGRDLTTILASEAGTKRQRPTQTSMGFGFAPGSPLVPALDEGTIPSGALDSPLQSHASRAATPQSANEDSDLHEFLGSMSDQTRIWTPIAAKVRAFALHARLLLGVLRWERMHSVEMLRASLAAERLRPVVNHFCDASFGLSTGEQDLERVAQLLGALHGLLPVLPEGLAVVLTEADWAQVAKSLDNLVDLFGVPDKFLEDPLVQARLAAAHQSLARALERAGRTAEAAAEDEKADAILNWVCVFPAPGHTLTQPEICSITRQPMKDPVIIESGHTFERAAIECWFKKNNTCPITRVKLRRRTMIPNKAIKQYTDLYLAATGGWIPTATWPDPEPTQPENNVKDPLKFPSAAAGMEAVFGVPKEFFGILKETETWLADDGDAGVDLEASFNELTVTDGGGAPTAGLREEWMGGGEPILPGLEVEVGS